MSKTKFNAKHFIIAFFICAGVILAHDIFYVRKTITKRGVYTIALLTNYEYVGRTSDWSYHFYYKGIKYNGGKLGEPFSPKDIGKRFFVQFLENNPRKCILFHEEVPACMPEPPAKGWRSVPDCFDDSGRLIYRFPK